MFITVGVLQTKEFGEQSVFASEIDEQIFSLQNKSYVSKIVYVPTNVNEI